MKRAAIFTLAILTCGILAPHASGQAVPPPSAARPALPQANITRQTAFAIPFSINEQGAAPTEVQLFISTDRGQIWNFHAREVPTARQFGFRAKQDGEYWFAVKTLDALGNAYPAADLAPALIVIIDTKQPQLRFEAAVGASGEIAANWSCADPHIVKDSLRIEFRPVVALGIPVAPWQQVAVQSLGGVAARDVMAGNTTWWPGTHTTEVEVRATVRDRAGNFAKVSRRLSLPRRVTQSPPAPLGANSLPAQDPFTRRQQTAALPATTPPTTTPPSSTTPPPTTQPPTTQPPTTVPPTTVPPTTPPADAYSTSARPQANNFRRADAAGAPTAPSNGPSQFSNYSKSSPSDPVQTTTQFPIQTDPASPAMQNSVSTNTKEAPVGPTRWQDMLPAGEQLRMTNKRRLMLDFDVDAVGPSGVSQVDLWTTRDGGRSWEKWGSDPDNRSPLPVEVDREGVYGFRIAITSGIGFSSPPPQPGELADLWVGVDLTTPTAKIISVPLDKDRDKGNLIINWSAYDQHLAERPITLSFGNSQDGPWTPIASDLPNTGTFNWRITAAASGDIYLRIEARDEAGNIGIHQPSAPINIDGLRPRGRIRNLRPVPNG